MFASRLAGPLTAGFFVKQPKASCVEGGLEALLVRMRQRRYPETIPVLASYWLRTVYASGYGRRHWKKLNRLLKRALGEHLPDALSRQAIEDIQTWIQQSALLTRRPSRRPPPRSERICATLSSDLLQPYINRLLNEWLPVEAARFPIGGGIPLARAMRTSWSKYDGTPPPEPVNPSRLRIGGTVQQAKLLKQAIRKTRRTPGPAASQGLWHFAPSLARMV